MLRAYIVSVEKDMVPTKNDNRFKIVVGTKDVCGYISMFI